MATVPFLVTCVLATMICRAPFFESCYERGSVFCRFFFFPPVTGLHIPKSLGGQCFFENAASFECLHHGLVYRDAISVYL